MTTCVNVWGILVGWLIVWMGWGQSRRLWWGSIWMNWCLSFPRRVSFWITDFISYADELFVRSCTFLQNIDCIFLFYILVSFACEWYYGTGYAWRRIRGYGVSYDFTHSDMVLTSQKTNHVSARILATWFIPKWVQQLSIESKIWGRHRSMTPCFVLIF